MTQKTMISLGLLLVLLVVILGAIAWGVYRLRKRVQEFSRAAFGTDSITEGAEKMRREYSTTPKSVSAMTSLVLPRIVADFPDFTYDEMKERAENVLTSYLLAVNGQNQTLLGEGNSELRDQLENLLEQRSAMGQWEHYDQIHIHRTELSQYRKTEGRCIIVFQSSLECFHYITDEAGQIVDGTKDYKYQTKYNVDLIYIQDRDKVENDRDHALGINCPNCGAPLSSLGAKVCEYCGTPVLEFNIHAWSFSHIEEIKN